jgi:Uma2 family endonuclease
MATTNTLTTSPADAENDPFRYGWRYLRREKADGTEIWERMPLTLEDVLHPQEEDVIVQNRVHQLIREYLRIIFAAQLAHDPTAIVLTDVRVAWDVPGLEAHGPDIAVITGVREIKNWSTFDVAVEGARPELVVEITSPSTAGIDRMTKLEEYETASVPTYVIIDTVGRRSASHLRLFGYTLTPAGYQVLTPDERDWLWLDAVQVWLGIADGAIVCYDEAGQSLGDYVAVTEALRAETGARQAAETLARAEAEAVARALAEERLRQLEAELARLRGEE